MTSPDVTLHEQTSQIRSPRIPGPPQNLLKEPPVRLHRTEQLCLGAALHVRVPAMADHPARQELVVARVQLVLAQPVVVGETVKEFGVLEDDSAVGGCSAGETGQATVNVG